MSRRKPQPLPAFKPCLLLVKWKHGTQFFNCPTEAHLYSACLRGLKLKHGAGWFGKPVPTLVPKPNFARETIELLPEGPVRDAAKKQWGHYEGTLHRNEKEQIEYDQVLAAIKYNDGALAGRILDHYDFLEKEYLDECPPLPEPEDPQDEQRFSETKSGKRWIYDAPRGEWIRGDYARMDYNQQVADGEEPHRV